MIYHYDCAMEIFLTESRRLYLLEISDKSTHYAYLRSMVCDLRRRGVGGDIRRDPDGNGQGEVHQ